jgi:hypothetical protein
MRQPMLSRLLLFVLCGACFAQEAHFQVVANATGAALNIDLSGVASTDGARIKMFNNSGSSLAVPSLTLPGVVPPLNRQTIDNYIIQTSSTHEQLAIAGWQYMLDHITSGYCSAGSSSDPGGYASDPMHIFYGYGIGCCDQLANVLAWIWAGAGYQARVAMLNFHTIPEIYYDGAWHLLDPDHRVFYRKADNSIASVADVLADPSLVANTHDQNGLDPIGFPAAEMAELYEENAPSLRYVKYGFTAPPDPLFVLLPHESLEFQNRDPWPTWLYYNASETALSPASLGAAAFRRTADFTNSSWQAQAASWQGVQVSVQADGRQALMSQTGGGVLFKKTSPFPIVEMQLTGEFANNHNAGFVSVTFSADGVNWSAPVTFPASDSTGHAAVDLTQVAQGAYTYYVQVQINDPTVAIYELPIRVDVQTGAPMFPQLVAGQVNTVVYQDLSPTQQTRNVQITVSIPEGEPALDQLQAHSQVREDPTYSVARNYLAQNLVDGDTSTLAYPGSSPIDYVVNLGGARNVSQVSVWWGVYGTNSAYVNQWKLFGRTGPNSPWQSLASGGFPNSTVTDMFVAGNGLTDIRITAGSANWIGLYEVQIYGSEPPLSAESQIKEDPIYSVARGYVACKLVDGSPATLAYPANFNIDYIVHLPAESHATSTSINWGYFGTNPAYINGWSMYGRIGESNWLSLGSGGYPNSTITTVQMDTMLTDVRLTAHSSANWIGAYDMSVSASSPIQPKQILSNAPYEDESTYPLANLTDGNTSTLAYPAQYFNDFQLDFGSNTYIDSVNITWGYFGTDPTYVKAWTVYGQRDGEYAWIPLAWGDFPNASTSIVGIQRTIRHLRVSATSSNWIGIYEVQAFSYAK